METTEEVLSFDNFSKTVFKSVMESTKHVNGLPACGSDFEYWSSYESFAHLTHHQGMKILDLIQFILSKHNLKTDIASGYKLLDIEERFDLLTDACDQLMERIGINLDDASGSKKNTSLVVSSKLNNTTPSSTSSSLLSSSTVTSSQYGGFKKKSITKTPIYTLMTSKVVTRSQENFKDKIDNSNNPFVPKLTEKPNAILPLGESLKLPEGVIIDDVENYLEYPHPYQHELNQFKPTPKALERVIAQVPKSIEETPFSYIDTEEKFDELVEKLKTSAEVAVDLEHHSFRSFQGFTCLMQLSTREEDFVVDTLALRHCIHKINSIFTDPNIVKIFHGADSDVIWLQKDFGVYLVNMFDTGQAARVLNLPFFSFAYALQHYCNVKADKQYQLADWRIRPLPDEFIKYAREDTHYLLYIYDCMKNDLLLKSHNDDVLLINAYNNSTNLCLKRYQKPRLTDMSHRDVYMNIKARSSSAKHHLNERQMEALKRLYAWRDKIARLEDESTGYVLPNQMMLQLAEYLPKEPEGILACCNPLPMFVKKELHDIHRIIKQVRDLPASYFLNNSTSKNTSMLDASMTSPTTSTMTSNDKSHTRTMKPDRMDHPMYYNLFVTKYKSNILNGLYADDEDNGDDGEDDDDTTNDNIEDKKQRIHCTIKDSSNQQQSHQYCHDQCPQQNHKTTFFSILCINGTLSSSTSASTSLSTSLKESKIEMIRSKLVCPFVPFLPENLVDKKLLASFTKWKLLPHTNKQVNVETTQKEVKVAAKDDDEGLKVESAQTVRDKIHSEKQENEDAKTPSSAGKRKLTEDEILQTPFSGIVKSKKAKKSKKDLHDNDEDGREGQSSSSKVFTAKEYKSEDMQKILESGCQESANVNKNKNTKSSNNNNNNNNNNKCNNNNDNKKRQFDPLDDTPQFQPKNVTKPHGSHSNNKSYSYKNQTPPFRNITWSRDGAGRSGGGGNNSSSGGGGASRTTKIPWPGKK